MTPSDIGDRLEAHFAPHTSTIGRELKLNLKKFLLESSVTPEHAAPTLLALATTTGDRPLAALAAEWMTALGYPEDQILEAREAAAMMALLNTFYAGRSKLADASIYGPAGLRMTAVARPALGKERFERLAFAVSVVNGCATCIAAHEKALSDIGVSAQERFDLLRLGAAAKAVAVLS